MSDNEADRWWNDPDKANKPMPNSLIGISILPDDMQPVLVERVIYTQFRVVNITNNIDEYGTDNAEFPHLVEYVQDEEETFVVDTATGKFYTGSEFFYLINIKSFTAEVIADE